jgi:hypothetical protein
MVKIDFFLVKKFYPMGEFLGVIFEGGLQDDLNKWIKAECSEDDLLFHIIFRATIRNTSAIQMNLLLDTVAKNIHKVYDRETTLTYFKDYVLKHLMQNSLNSRMARFDDVSVLAIYIENLSRLFNREVNVDAELIACNRLKHSLIDLKDALGESRHLQGGYS